MCNNNNHGNSSNIGKVDATVDRVESADIAS